MRIKLASLFLSGVFLFLFFNTLSLSVIHGRRYRELSRKNCIRLLPQAGSRGRILDRQARAIADNRLSYDVMVMPQDNQQLAKTMARVADILKISLEDLKKEFRASFSGAFLPTAIARNINFKKAFILEERKLDIPGIIIQPHPERYYPYASLACHLLGYLGEIDRWRLTKLADYGYKTKDIVGFGGVEEKYDYYLRQEEGGISMEVDYLGRFVRTMGFRPPHNGRDVQLTLDLRIQMLAEEALSGRRGCVIVMEPATGEIVAMASSPGFNPGIFSRKENFSISDLLEKESSPLLNRAISAVYPAGSVFKPVVASAAIETGKINALTTFFCSGGMNIGGRRFLCWDAHNRQNLFEAIAHSCNVFFYHTGILAGAQTIYEYALKFGFAKLTGIDLPYEASGIVPSPLWKRVYRFQHWFEGDSANLSIGQGDLLVTPLQLTRMTAVFANRGFLVRPYVLKAVGGQEVSLYQRKITRLALKQDTIEQVRQGLRGAVTDASGTANILLSLPITVAGKTGTAQVSRGQHHGWFIGFFPFKNPQFVICVFLENGGSGFSATLLTKKIIEGMLGEGLI